ncbi:MAG: hypothetical protein IT430_00875 [Phycisphaerales bacterium]|nr:hypothetical protein [Phycisphaerales bacterium]
MSQADQTIAQAPPPPPPHPRSRSAGGGTSRQLIKNSLSSYARLLGTFTVGLIVTRYLIQANHLGAAGFGLFVLLMSSVGIINILQSTVRAALVRELSSAFHGGEAQEIRSAFTAAFASCVILGIALGGLMVVCTPLALWVFQFGPAFASQMWWSWVTLSAYTAWVVMTSPFITLLDATHRIPQRNLEALMERFASLVAAGFVFSQQWGRDYPLISYVAANCGFTALVRLGFGAWAYVTAPQVNVELKTLRFDRVRDIFFLGAHVGKGEIATNLYDRTNQLLINIFLGATLNGLFGVVVLLVGYTKQIAMGISFGIEPMAAKFSHSGQGARELVGSLVLAIARVQSGVIFPIIAVLFMMGQILVNIWLGDRFSIQRFAANRDIAQMLMILLVGSPFFVIMQGPLRIMLGAGDVKAYANRLLQAGILQACVAALILWFVPDIVHHYYWKKELAAALQPWGAMMGPAPLVASAHAKLLAENAAMYAVAASMSLIYLLVYGLYVPVLACRLYNLRLRDMYIGALMPGALIGAVIGVLLAAWRWWIENWNIWLVLLGLALAAVIALPLFWLFVLTATERKRLVQIMRRRRA